MNTKILALLAAAVCALAAAAQAQQVLVPENHTWSYLHPMGTLPPRPDLTPDPDFDTTWYLSRAQFTANYDGPSFSVLKTGDPAILDSADSGPGPGPFAYGTVDNILTPGTALTTPASGSRNAAYFRTTFTVPAGGLVEPTIRVACDDGCFLYLDGALIATVNIATAVTDTYTSFAADATNTEVDPTGIFSFHLRSAGSQPGASPGDVDVLVPVPVLAAGEHTLALSVHNSAADSSDLGMLLELSALNPATCTVHAVVTDVVRDVRGTPGNISDDQFSFKVTLSGNNNGGTWNSNGLPASGAYGVVTAFGPFDVGTSPALITFSASTDPLCQTSVSVDTPAAPFTTVVDYNQTWKVMNPQAGVLPDRPAGGVDTNFETTWFLKENDFLTQYDGPTFGTGGVAGSYEAIEGPGPFDAGTVDGIAAGQPVGVEGTVPTLPPSGSRRTSYYRTNFTTTEPLSLLTIDLLCDDGVFIYLDGNLVAQENMPDPPAPGFNVLATAARNETLLIAIDLSQPPGGNVISTVSALAPGTHTLAVALHQSSTTSSDFGLALKVSGIEVVGQCILAPTTSNVIRNTAGTPVNPADDTFAFDVVVTGANAGATWNSNSTPASGNFGTVAHFGPFPVSAGSATVIFSSPIAPACTASIVVTPPPCTMSAVTGNATRDADVTPLDPRDDTFSFEVTAAGTFVSTQWATNQAVPASGAYGVATRIGPFPATGAATVILNDSVETTCTTSVTVQPPRFVPSGVIVSYSKVWKVMNPQAGIVPDGPVGPDADFETTWFLAESAFIAQYNGPTFGTGGVAGSYEAIEGPGPFDSGLVDGLAAGMTLGPPGTALMLPATDLRYTSYYRTTFTTAVDMDNLKFDVLCDDGVFIYLDGELIALENIAEPDTYTGLATAARGETLIITIDLSEAPGANVLKTIPSLAAGTHTLAVSVHQSAITSSDFGLALTFYGRAPTVGGDSDGDGQSDASEALAGTNPNNPNDYLRITGIVRNGTGANATFPSVSGKNYQVEVSAALASGWTAFGPVTAGTGAAITVNIPQIPVTPADRKYFLRVKVVP